MLNLFVQPENYNNQDVKQASNALGLDFQPHKMQMMVDKSGLDCVCHWNGKQSGRWVFLLAVLGRGSIPIHQNKNIPSCNHRSLSEDPFIKKALKKVAPKLASLSVRFPLLAK